MREEGDASTYPRDKTMTHVFWQLLVVLQLFQKNTVKQLITEKE